ncbi:MAG: heme ABC exporter ATP-binding protein CcmA [Gammaproteobacteria bacterium]|nr:heme ABC exporter ATP-binding protein CcmA [Gammaproteobacteria bacterium]
MRAEKLPNSLITAHEIYYETSGRELFSGLNATVRSGELVEVYGPNGSGKTTLLRILAGLHRPDSGQVIRHANSTGFLSHRVGLARLLTVRENIRWSIALSRAHFAEARVLSVLKQFELTSCAQSLVRDLSAGQVKRSALAALVLSDHQLWLLDEPSGSLDAEGEELLCQTVSSHCQAGGAAIVATHTSIALTANRRIDLGST